MLASIRECDGHHEMSDFGADGEPVHSNGESVAPAWPHQPLDGPRWLIWEKIMSKTKHTESREDRELSVQELETVAGGTTTEAEDKKQCDAIKAFQQVLQELP